MLLRHGHMQPRPPQVSPDSDSDSDSAPGLFHSIMNRPPLSRFNHNHDYEYGHALAVDALPAPRRRRSKNCATIKRFGDRLSVRRRQRRADRTLRADMEQLQQTLAAIDRRRTLLDSLMLTRRPNAEAAALEMVRTYFAHMKHGLGRGTNVDVVHTTPMSFLETILAPDLKCQEFQGRQHFFQQWQYVTMYHADIEMEALQLVALPSDRADDDVLTLQAMGHTNCRISRATLVHFFPHILHDEPLVQWLVGKQYSYTFTMVLYVNRAGQVFQFESQIELTSGLLTLLQDPRSTLQMIDSSMWTTCGNLRGQVHEDRNAIVANGVLT